MIHRVDNQSYTNRYSQNVSKVKNTAEDTPAFLLGNEEEGVVWERQKDNKDKRKQSSIRQTKEQQKANNNTFSDSKRSAVEIGQQSRNDNTEKVTGDSADFHQMKDKIALFIRKLIKAIANFFWYGEETSSKQNTKESATDNVQSEKQTVSETYSEATETETLPALSSLQEQAPSQESSFSTQEKDARIRELLAKKDTEGVMDILTDHHTRQLAKKTGLLTQYDRHGVIIMPSGGEQSRILMDDKGMKM